MVISNQMIFVGMIFTIMLLLTYSFVLPTMGTKAISQRQLRSRIASASRGEEQVRSRSLLRRRYLEGLAPWERELETAIERTPLRALRNLLNRGGFQFPVYRFVALCLAGGAGGAGGVLRLLPDPTFAVVGAAVGLFVPVLWLGYRGQQRTDRFERELPDALGVIARSLRAGLPFSQALSVVAEQGEGGPVADEFRLVYSELNYGANRDTVLFRLLERVPTVTVMAMVAAIRINSESGGNLAEIMERLERLLRERFRFQRRLKAMTASGRMAAMVVSIMPFLLGGFMEWSSPGWIMTLTETPQTRQLLYIVFGMMVGGILWIRSMTRIDI